MKNFKIYIGAVALFALVAVNVWNATTIFSASELTIDEIEACGGDNGDRPRLNWPWLWFSQGLTADEEPYSYLCSVTNGRYIDTQTTEVQGSAQYNNNNTDWQSKVGNISGEVSFHETSTYGSQHEYSYHVWVTTCNGGTTNCSPTKPNPCNDSRHNSVKY